MGPKPNDWCSLRRLGDSNHTHRDTRGWPCEDRSRDWTDRSTSQGMPRIANSQQKLGEKHGMDPPSEPVEGTNLVNTLVHFSCFKPLSLWLFVWQPKATNATPGSETPVRNSSYAHICSNGEPILPFLLFSPPAVWFLSHPSVVVTFSKLTPIFQQSSRLDILHVLFGWTSHHI